MLAGVSMRPARVAAARVGCERCCFRESLGVSSWQRQASWAGGVRRGRRAIAVRSLSVLRGVLVSPRGGSSTQQQHRRLSPSELPLSSARCGMASPLCCQWPWGFREEVRESPAVRTVAGEISRTTAALRRSAHPLGRDLESCCAALVSSSHMAVAIAAVLYSRLPEMIIVASHPCVEQHVADAYGTQRHLRMELS